jgi:hypothetical protein
MINFFARIPHDKLLHFAAGYLLATLAILLGAAPDLSLFFVGLVATLREAYNLSRAGGKFSFADIGATVLGCLPLLLVVKLS